MVSQQSKGLEKDGPMVLDDSDIQDGRRRRRGGVESLVLGVLKIFHLGDDDNELIFLISDIRTHVSYLPNPISTPRFGL